MKLYFLLIGCTFFALSLTAQRTTKSDSNSRHLVIKIERLVNKLSLTPEETEEFIPQYKNYSTEVENAKINLEKYLDSGIDSLSNQELREFLQLSLQAQSNIKGIQRRYVTIFGEIIKYEKVMDLFVQEQRDYDRMFKNNRRKSESNKKPNLQDRMKNNKSTNENMKGSDKKNTKDREKKNKN